MNDNTFNQDIDWKSLSIKIKSKMKHKHKTIIAVMPQHPPARILGNFAEGIYPIKEISLSNKDEDKF